MEARIQLRCRLSGSIGVLCEVSSATASVPGLLFDGEKGLGAGRVHNKHVDVAEYVTDFIDQTGDFGLTSHIGYRRAVVVDDGTKEHDEQRQSSE